jgi:hypothetical protein
MLDSFGMGYRANPSYMTFEMLHAAAREPINAAVIRTRSTQISTFSRPQRNKYSVGFEVRLRGREHPRRKQFSSSEKDRALYIERYLLNTGLDYNVDRDSFDTFIKRFTYDSLVLDQACVEKTRTRGGDPHAFYAVPSDTMRLAEVDKAAPSGRPLEEEELRRKIRYVQIMDARRWKDFTADEMAFCVRNPRTSTRVYRYGFPEIELLITTITSLLWATEYNRRLFSQGSTIRAIINLQGKIPPKILEDLKKQWHAQLAGVQNAWKTPVVNSDGMQVFPLQWNNREMEFQAWLEFNTKLSCAIWQIDPSEINFDLRGSSQQQPLFMSSNEAQQKVSKDRGLTPLLRFVEDSLNRHIVWAIDDRFELAFVGLDAKTEEQATQLRLQQGQSHLTLNEVRALEDLDPVEHGDVVLNPVYTSVLQLAAAEKAAAQQGAGGGGGAPGASPDAPPPTEEDQAFLADPGEEERRGAARVVEFLGAKNDEKGTGPNPENESSLFREDWTSSVRSSVAEGDLKKSERKYEVLDLD